MPNLITLAGIDDAIAHLAFRKDTLKTRLLLAIRSRFRTEESLEEITAIPAEEIIRQVWGVSDPEQITNKRKRLSRLKSSINRSLLQLMTSGRNPEGVIISRDNIFAVAEERNLWLAQSDPGTESSSHLTTLDLRNYVLENLKQKGPGVARKLLAELETAREFLQTIAGRKDHLRTSERDHEAQPEDSGTPKIQEAEEKQQESGSPAESFPGLEFHQKDESRHLEILQAPPDASISEGSAPPPDGIAAGFEEESGFMDHSELERELLEDDFEELELQLQQPDVTIADGSISAPPAEAAAGSAKNNIPADEFCLGMKFLEEDELAIMKPRNDDLPNSASDVPASGSHPEKKSFQESPPGTGGERSNGLLSGGIPSDRHSAVKSRSGNPPGSINQGPSSQRTAGIGDVEGLLETISQMIVMPGSNSPEIAESSSELEEAYLPRLLHHLAPRYQEIPSGKYQVGSKKPDGREQERRTIHLERFELGQFPVTNDLFELFVRETGYRTDAEKRGYGLVFECRSPDPTEQSTGRPHFSSGISMRQVDGASWRHPAGPGTSINDRYRHPVVQVSMADALAFARWVDKSLPSEEEWEVAAGSNDGRLFPWGDDWSAFRANLLISGHGETTTVNHHGEEAASPFGIQDLLGNVYEWTTTVYSDVKTGGRGVLYVLKGGSWATSGRITIAHRMVAKTEHWSNIIGFRCGGTISAG